MHCWIVSIGAALRARAQRMTVPQRTVRAAAVLRRIFSAVVTRGVDRCFARPGWVRAAFESGAASARARVLVADALL